MMADSLRDALEKLASKWEARQSTPAGFYPEASAHADGLDGGYEGAADDLRELLAAHPSEPAEVSDEAVEAAQKAWTKAYWTEATPGKVDWMRAALEAAQPFM